MKAEVCKQEKFTITCYICKFFKTAFKPSFFCNGAHYVREKHIWSMIRIYLRYRKMQAKACALKSNLDRLKGVNPLLFTQCLQQLKKII